MATDSVTVSPTFNGDSVSLTAGAIVRLKPGANNNVVRALADTALHVQGVNGVVVSGASAPGGVVTVVCTGRETVQMESALTPSVSDTVFVSASVAGSGTNVAPGVVAPIGTIADVSNYARLGTVEVDVNIGVGASAGGGGSSDVITGFDTSAMTGGSGTLASIAAPGFVWPADALDPRSANVIACFSGGQLLTGGSLVLDAQFTTDGGLPIVGQKVYAASAFEDGATGRGKFTATPPLAGAPPFAGGGITSFPAYPVGVGICLGPGSAGRFIVKLSLPNSPEQQSPQDQPANQNYNGAEFFPLDATKNFSTNGNFTQASLHDQEYLAILFNVENTTGFVGANGLVGNTGGGQGWSLFLGGGGVPQLTQFGLATTSLFFGTAAPGIGLHCIVVTIDGGFMRGCLDGLVYAEVAINVATIVDPSAGFTLSVGNTTNVGGIQAIVKGGRPLSAGEVVEYSSTVLPTAPADRYVLASGLVNDPAMLWLFRAIDWAGPPASPTAVAGPAWPVGGISFTINPTPTTGPGRVAKTETWFRSLAKLIVDTEPIFLDSYRYPHGSPGNRVAFTLPAGNSQICVGAFTDDADDGDNSGIAIFIDGVFTTAVQPGDNGFPQYLWIAMPGTAPGTHTIEVVGPDKVQRPNSGGVLRNDGSMIDLVAGTGQTFVSPTVARRLVFVGDNNSIGHDAGLLHCPMFNSISTLLRTDYPGSVTVMSATSRALFYLWNFGGGSINIFAAQIIETAELGGAPATVDVMLNLGFNDYVNGGSALVPQTLAQFIARYGQLLDRLHSLRSAYNIFVANLWAPFYDAVPNATGETQSQYRTAIAGLTTGRAWLTVFDPRTPNPVTMLSPGTPEEISQAPGGTDNAKANIKVGLGY